jgi:hypothetical protein
MVAKERRLIGYQMLKQSSVETLQQKKEARAEFIKRKKQI